MNRKKSSIILISIAVFILILSFGITTYQSTSVKNSEPLEIVKEEKTKSKDYKDDTTAYKETYKYEEIDFISCNSEPRIITKEDVNKAYEYLKNSIEKNKDVTVMRGEDLYAFDLNSDGIINLYDQETLEKLLSSYQSGEDNAAGYQIFNLIMVRGQVPIIVILAQFSDISFGDDIQQDANNGLLNRQGGIIWDMLNSNVQDEFYSVKECFNIFSFDAFNPNFVIIDKIFTTPDSREDIDDEDDGQQNLIGQVNMWMRDDRDVQRQLANVNLGNTPLYIILTAGTSPTNDEALWPKFVSSRNFIIINERRDDDGNLLLRSLTRTTAHEMGHSIGAPDVYIDSDLLDEIEAIEDEEEKEERRRETLNYGAGYWSLMASGYYPDAYCYLLSTWVNVITIDNNRYNVRLQNMLDQENAGVNTLYRIWNGLDYFLVEYRSISNLDEDDMEMYRYFYPTIDPDGVFPWHIGDSPLDNNGFHFNTDVLLVQSDGLNELNNLDTRDNDPDEGDYWVPPMMFSQHSDPNSNFFNDRPSYYAVRLKERREGYILADLLRGNYDYIELGGWKQGEGQGERETNFIRILDRGVDIILSVFGRFNDNNRTRPLPNDEIFYSSTRPNVANCDNNAPNRHILHINEPGQTIIRADYYDWQSNDLVVQVDPVSLNARLGTEEKSLVLEQNPALIKIINNPNAMISINVIAGSQNIEPIDVTNEVEFIYNDNVISIEENFRGNMVIRPVNAGRTQFQAQLGDYRTNPITIEVYDIARTFIYYQEGEFRYTAHGALLSAGDRFDLTGELILRKGNGRTERYTLNEGNAELMTDINYVCDYINAHPHQLRLDNNTGVFEALEAGFDTYVYLSIAGDQRRESQVRVVCIPIEGQEVRLTVQHVPKQQPGAQSDAFSTSAGRRLQAGAYVTIIGGETFLVDEGVSWGIQHPNIASIDERGNVTARNRGTTRIQVRHKDIISGEAILTVTARFYISRFNSFMERFRRRFNWRWRRGGGI